jgi:hypothetical protein
MNEPLVLLVVGFLGTWFVGAAGRAFSTYFVEEQISPIVGFSIAIGFVVSGGFCGVQASTDLQQAMLNIGMIAGLGLIWFRYFKRQKAGG